MNTTEKNYSYTIQNLTVNKVATNGSKQSAQMRGNVQVGGGQNGGRPIRTFVLEELCATAVDLFCGELEGI